MCTGQKRILIDDLPALRHREGAGETAFRRRGRNADFRLGLQRSLHRMQHSGAAPNAIQPCRSAFDVRFISHQLSPDQDICPNKEEKHERDHAVHREEGGIQLREIVSFH